MGEYRDTPERRAELARLANTASTSEEQNRAMLPPAWLMYMQSKYAEEDRLIDEFGHLPRFDWVLTDESGTEMGTRRISRVSTLIEAIQQATEYWRKAHYKVIGQLHAERSDGKRFD